MAPLMTDPDRIHALLESRILPHVETPARYLGGELNAVRKDPASVDVRIAFCFPDVYEVGMSHLGYQILYSIINDLDWAAAERAYAVWPDMQAQMRANGIPLFALESFRPVREFDALGFSLQYELLSTNVLAMLDLAGVPLRSADRGHPALIQKQKPVAGLGRQVKVMGHRHHRQTLLLAKPAGQAVDRGLVLKVQESGRLIQEEQSRLLSQGPGQDHPLLFSPGKLV